MERTVIECDNCGTILNEPADIPEENKEPCPKCGSMIRMKRLQLTDSIKMIPMIKTKHRNSNGDILQETKNFKELYRESNKWQDTSYSINKRDDKYDKIVTDPDTGDILYECHEKLSEHQERGSAKHSKKKKDQAD